MPFAIQACAPIVSPSGRRTAADLADAVSTIFPVEAGDAFMIWNWVPIRLSYRYDLGVLIDDLIPLLHRLVTDEIGSARVYWGSNTFGGEWKLDWARDDLTIIATWKNVAGGYEELLNSRGTLQVGRRAFLAQWSGLLGKVIDGVRQSRIKIERSALWEDLERLKVALEALTRQKG
jgi:hypothetical protein